MEKAIRQTMISYPQLLLVQPVDRKRDTPQPKIAVAESMEDLQNIPDAVSRNLKTVLEFQAGLLRNATSKSLYASVEKMADLLACADDELADAALSVLMSLAVPPDLYKQQSPDSSTVNGSTALHSSKTQCHARLTACAVGWGTRAQGLGLEAVVSADDASDPPEAGFLDFGYYETGAEEMSRIFMEHMEMFRDKDEMSVEEGTSDESSASKKRRRVMETKSTAELFFTALQKAGGRSKIPQDRLFSLLADVRLARSFHSRALRVRAVERRLKALITITHSHPSQEVMTGYFQAQPELCVEIVDLLRPTISSAHVSANAANPGIMQQHDAIAGLAQGTSIPLRIQVLAVELLTALVCRRDGSTTALSGSSRLSGVFVELGLGKGQYMGVLPTLVRYSLAALTAEPPAETTAPIIEDEDPMVEIGLEFVHATMAPLSPRPELVLKALEFIERVLTLTSTIVSNATGASALTEGGLIPSVLNLIAIPSESMVQRLLGSHDCSVLDRGQILAKVRFVTAQVLQILEASVVTHSNSLTAFHDLQGVESLVSKLASEMEVSEEENDDSMDIDESETVVSLRFSQRVLLYGLFTCLTVVFHQEPSSALATSSQTGSAQLRKPALTKAVKKVMNHVVSYDGHIAYLVSTLLADVMNNDPQIVRHVHSSGIGRAVLSMLNSVEPGSGNPVIPPVGDLITALPNVLSALALTEDGAQAVFDVNPFPSLLKVYHNPKYTMPQNRCLLNDNTSFIGTGLEEVMRHVDKLKPLIIDAVVTSLKEIIQSAQELADRESEKGMNLPCEDLVDSRSALIQYILNAGQILEHILHNEDNITPFVDAGGLDAILDLFRSSLPKGRQFLAQISALSSPSVSTLHHSTVEDVLFMALRCIVVKYDPVKLTQKLAAVATEYVNSFDDSRQKLLGGDSSGSILQCFPTRPLHELGEEKQLLDDLSAFLFEAASIQWITSCLGMSIKMIVRRGEEPVSPVRRVESDWKKEMASESLRALFLRLAKVNQSAVLDVCQIRGTVAFEEREKVRLSSGVQGVKFRLRIVCPEGAIVRDGIEIDSCASVGSMSMGEVADAFDRCVNSSGILRYRTSRGWVSEMTRGHGREPITEVLDMSKTGVVTDVSSSKTLKKRLEYGIPDLQTVGCGVLARLQTSHRELVSALSKMTVQCVRVMDPSSLSFEEGTPGGIVKMTIHNLAEISQSAFYLLRSEMQSVSTGKYRPRIDDAGAAMYLGFVLDSFYSCLFDEKRERRIVNLPLLMNLTSGGEFDVTTPESGKAREDLSDAFHFGYLDAIEYLFDHCLNDFEIRSSNESSLIPGAPPVQRVGRSVASTIAPLIRFIRRLVCTPISLSPLASILSRLKWNQIPSVSGDEGIRSVLFGSVPENDFFEPEQFARGLNNGISDIVQKVWEDERLRYAPPYLVHPVAGLVGEVIVALEGLCKKKPKLSRPTHSRGQLLSEWIRGTERQQEETEAGFDASDDAIQRLREMGFSEDHALDALERTRSNQIDVAMEYALSHPPPSPPTAERQRAQRAERQRRREENRLSLVEENESQGTSNTTEQQNIPDESQISEGLNIKEKPVGEDCQISQSHEKLKKWIDTAALICCRIMTGSRGRNLINKAADGDAETEAMSVVLCSFLFDLCHRYPDKKSSVLKSLLDELKNAIHKSRDDSQNDHAIAALCHAVVLFTRALPKTRLMVLESCLVGDVVSLLSEQVIAKLPIHSFVWPEFLSASLLFLEVMAQPVVAFTGKDPLKDFTDIYKDEASLPVELSAVYRQHMQQKAAFSDLARSVFEVGVSESKELSDSPGTEEPKTNPFELVPSFFSLLPKDSVASCFDICKKVISARPKSGSPPPGIIHGVLLLLLQLIRDPHISTECLRDGMADEILDLPPSCRFTGNTGLVTLVLRRLLEDETTLQAALESEIKTAIAKIHAKDKDNPMSDSTGIPLAKFLEAVTPLICRDQMSFLRALCMSVRLESPSSRGGTVVVLRLNQQERATASKALAALLPVNKDMVPARVDMHASTGARRRSSSGGTPKGKALTKNIRRSSAKKARNLSQTLTSPAATIVSLLINLALKSLVKERDLTGGKDALFLSCAELLDVLSDLVIAVPACSPVVHNYRPFKNKDKLLKTITGNGLKHALANTIHLPKTFVSFLLHFLLGQDRWSMKYDPQLWDRPKEARPDDEKVKAKKRAAFRLARTTQAAGRVLAVLAARPGDGRKRVIEDLAFALSGGRLGHGGLLSSNKLLLDKPGASTIHALQAWGELCLGLIAPRGSGKTLEGSSSICVENVKIMLDCGMVHALLFALHHIPLTHPMAPSACEALLLPVEVLIRPSVSSAVRDFVEKLPLKPAEESGETKSYEGRNNRASGRNNEIEVETLVNVDSQGRGPMVDEEMDIDVGNEEQSSGSGMSHEDAEGDSSIEETESEMDDEDDDDEDDDDDDDDDDDEGSSLMDDNEVELRDGEFDDGNGWVDGNGDLVVYGGVDNSVGYDEVNDDVPVPALQQGIEDGWTRIESTGFGGFFMGAPRLGANHHAPGSTAGVGVGMDERNRGFIDAAEVMIGSLLRNNGEISSDAIAELEGTLGVRISHDRLSRGEPQDGLRDTGAVDSPFQGTTNVGRREAIGTVPHVHQRTQPEIGYSFASNSSRLFEVSSIEFVFGGPSVTSGSRNYDIVTPVQDDEVAENAPTLSQLDLQLFPQGPTTPNGGRTQMALHPLLCGVDLPPLNSVVSDLLPHGVRARRPGHLATRRPGEWTTPSLSLGGYLVSTSNGNIIRSNRPNSWAPLGTGMSSRDIDGPVGWTDDGLPFHSSVGDLTSALADALTASAPHPPEPPHETQAEAGSPTSQQRGETEADDRVAVMAVDSAPTTGQDQEAHDDDDDEGEDDPMNDANQSPRSATDGDQVASSLAVGLRLSVDSGEAEAGLNGAHDEETVPQPADDMDISQDDEHPHADQEGHDEAADEEQEPSGAADSVTPNFNGLVCPPDIDPEVFESLPLDMQQDLVAEHAATQDLAAQVEGTSIDPDVLAELPEDIRNDILEQQRCEREARGQNNPPADPSRAEQMDNASFLASLETELRNEILLTADETFLNSLPSSIRAEADVLRERALAQRRTFADLGEGAAARDGPTQGTGVETNASDQQSGSRRRHRNGKIKVDLDQDLIVYTPESLSPPIARADIHLVTTFLYLLSPMRPERLMQQLVYNLSTHNKLRCVMTALFIGLLHNDIPKTTHALEEYSKCYKDNPDDWRTMVDRLFLDVSAFPPNSLIGAAPDLPESDPFSTSVSASLLRRKQGLGTAASAAANLPKSVGGQNTESKLPLVVTNRVINVLLSLCKSSMKYCLHLLEKETDENVTVFDKLLDLLAMPTFYKSAANLDHLLTLLESVVSPLSHLPKGKDEDGEITEKDFEAASAVGKTYADVPRVIVNQSRLKRLCSILRMETCRDPAFTKVNTIIRRLCRIEENRGYVLQELASVAHGLGTDAVRDLRSLRIRMEQASAKKNGEETITGLSAEGSTSAPGNAATSVALSTSTSELKLLRVLQALHSLCTDPGEDTSGKKHDTSIIVTEELLHLLRQMQFDELWVELSACLKIVHVLEGVPHVDEEEGEGDEGDDGSGDGVERGGRKLRNSAASLLARFLPAIEAFLIANASATRMADQDEASEGEELAPENLVGGKRLIEFVSSNRVLLNALVRNNASLLDKGLRALVQVPKCRQFLEFDVKRSWFKAQMRRLRQQASRRHGSLRLHIERDRVFQEAYNYLRLRNAEEMRGRLHVIFQNEEGVDAGGLSREFFAILAKEMFNPNYALFTATEDGCTFQPNQNSGINPDHLSFFRFVGRIVGKALADGYLLDAHFTRSLYKHMLGMQPTHPDMEAIDPDYYRNLKTILDFNLEDIGLDHLTFSMEDMSFGRTQIIDLVPNGRSIPVTEDNKEEYVSKICQYRMTTAIKNQIKAYLDGFHELINPELISIFTPRELELMISGLPDIDVDDLKKNTEYAGWRPADKEIGWFWKIMYELSRDEKAKFLQFVTGSAKVPLAGFSELQGMRGTKKFTINKDSSGGSKGALMSAHTCFNTLDLPVYQSEEELRDKLLYAINEGAGAFLFA